MFWVFFLSFFRGGGNSAFSNFSKKRSQLFGLRFIQPVDSVLILHRGDPIRFLFKSEASSISPRISKAGFFRFTSEEPGFLLDREWKILYPIFFFWRWTFVGVEKWRWGLGIGYKRYFEYLNWSELTQSVLSAVPFTGYGCKNFSQTYVVI